MISWDSRYLAVQQGDGSFPIIEKVDDIETAVLLLNIKKAGKRCADGVEKESPVHAAMADNEDVLPPVRSYYLLQGRNCPAGEVQKALTFRDAIVDNIGEPGTPLLRILGNYLRPGHSFPDADIEFPEACIKIRFDTELFADYFCPLSTAGKIAAVTGGYPGICQSFAELMILGNAVLSQSNIGMTVV